MTLASLNDRELLGKERELEAALEEERARNEGVDDDIRAYHAPSDVGEIVYRKQNKLEEVWLAVRRRGLKPWPRGW